ncbi:MAG: ComEC family competence protein [Chitinophagaceae bacterium]|nr:ComEC family competence protein [Chitinophagaceae bacterium]
MSKPLDIPIWKTAPVLRLLLPLTAGIILQWYLQVPILFSFTGIICFSAAFIVFSFLPIAEKFKLHFLQGILLQLILIAFGMLVTWNKDVRHPDKWYGNHYKEGDLIVVTIKEPLVEKTKSYKAEVCIEQVIKNDTAFACEGKLLLYFSKDSLSPGLEYGDRILISKKLIAIKNSGNPGAFNYERYAAFQQTFHNVFLKPSDWIKLDGKNVNQFQQFLYATREKILASLQKNIGSSKDELGIAEALLIGYTNDLDKDLVQAYSNTGVVHIIAISGMHLGLIYGMLIWLFARVPGIKRSKAAQAVLILSCLWLFSLLTGGSASVIRSAVMFSFITVGRMFFKESSIYSSLAASAFVMLCYNPYYLWDVGFQLSYLAVVGIVVFQQPIYNLIYVKNPYLDFVWKATALTTAAQLLTFPVCIYYFHQFPLLFLITNLIAVPLSTVILYAEIFLVIFSFIPAIGIYAGKAAAWLLWLMNKFILGINELPFAVWDKIPATVFTTWLLYGTVIFTAAWLMKKKSKLLQGALACLAGFILLHGIINWQVKSQQKIIVYNVPQHQAIDFVDGSNYRFVGDSILLVDGILQNFHLKPGPTALQLNNRVDTVTAVFQQDRFYQFGNKKIIVIDKPLVFETTAARIDVDMIVISKNPKLYIHQLANVFNCKQFVFDASNSLWKIENWKQDCDKLNLRYHSIPEQGAFVTDL